MRDALAYCQLAASVHNDAAFMRILKRTTRGIGALRLVTSTRV